MNRFCFFLLTIVLASCSGEKDGPPISSLFTNPAQTLVFNDKPKQPRIKDTVIVFSFYNPIAGLRFVSESAYDSIGTSIAGICRKPLPAVVDLSQKLPPVGSQGDQQSCVGWAVGYASRSYYLLKESRGMSNVYISPAFIFNSLNGQKNQPIYIKNALNLLVDTGACTLQSMPYNPADYTTRPGPKQIEEARQYRIETYRKIDLKNNSVNNLKAELANDNTVICALNYQLEYDLDGNMRPRPSPYLWERKKIRPLKGHAIVLVGYNDSLQAFKFMNSAGDTWGDQGYGWIRYQDALDTIYNPKNKNDRGGLLEAYVIVPVYKNAILDGLPSPPLLYECDADSLAIQGSNTKTKLQENASASNTRDAIRKSISSEITEIEYSKFGLNIYIDNVFVDSTSDNRNVLTTTDRIRVMGLVRIPQGLCRTFEVAVQFYTLTPNGLKDKPLMSRNNYYSLMNKRAAAFTQPIPVDPEKEGFEGYWICDLPISAIQFPDEIWKSDNQAVKLLAEPLLYTDGVPLRAGRHVEFQISDR
ncbi:MAG: C1 family peptidase [Bacteroidetes bacterium]|nr:C1 family peptidase [Bacteroidota bacterium]